MPVRALSALIGAAYLIAPDTVSKLVERRIFSRPRGRPHAPGIQTLQRAAVLQVPFDGQLMTVYRWLPPHGQPIGRALLVHGWAGDASHMTGFVQPLLDKGFEILAPDLPGHGRTQGSTSSVVQFSAAIRALQHQHGHFKAVIAHSMGAAAISHAAWSGANFQRIAFFGPVADYDTLWAGLRSRSGLHPALIRAAVRKAEQRLGVVFDEISPIRLAPHMRGSLFIVHDRDDLESPYAQGCRLSECWPAAELMSTQKLGHMRLLRDAAAISRAVEFVTQFPER